MRKVIFFVFVSIALYPLYCFAQNKQSQKNENLSRLGIKGYFGYVVTEINESVNQPEIQIGDIIISTEITGEVTDVGNFQSKIQQAKANTTIKALTVRFNNESKSFDEKYITLNTFPTAKPSMSKVGLEGVMGFAVSKLDVETKQSEIRLGDILSDTDVSGQLTSIDQFQNSVKSVGPGKEIQAALLVINSFTTSYKAIKLKTYEFPKIGESSGNATNQISCPLGNCSWCCAYCLSSQGNGYCSTSNCETGRSNCKLTPWRTCIMNFCA